MVWLIHDNEEPPPRSYDGTPDCAVQSMEHSLQQQKESFGFQDSDVDDLRRLISDTNVYLLIITLLASTLHLLFEASQEPSLTPSKTTP